MINKKWPLDDISNSTIITNKSLEEPIVLLPQREKTRNNTIADTMPVQKSPQLNETYLG